MLASVGNVHRNAESLLTDVHFAASETEAKLEVRDYGKRIDSSAGVNSSARRRRGHWTCRHERLRELGRLELESDERGALIRALIPVFDLQCCQKSAAVATEGPHSHARRRTPQ